jgi:hypothetical protein
VVRLASWCDREGGQRNVARRCREDSHVDQGETKQENTNVVAYEIRLDITATQYAQTVWPTGERVFQSSSLIVLTVLLGNVQAMGQLRVNTPLVALEEVSKPFSSEPTIS